MVMVRACRRTLSTWSRSNGEHRIPCASISPLRSQAASAPGSLSVEVERRKLACGTRQTTSHSAGEATPK